MLKNKTQILGYVVIAVFTFLLITSIQQSIFLSQEKTIEELEEKIQKQSDVISEIEVEIIKLTNDDRIRQIAKNKLNMDYPSPEDIYCVQKQKDSKNKIEYTFINFLTPEAVAADK